MAQYNLYQVTYTADDNTAKTLKMAAKTDSLARGKAARVIRRSVNTHTSYQVTKIS
jgi:hypothetical protein